MAPRKNHTCKYGKKADGYCSKRPSSGLGRSKAMKFRWEARRASGSHTCKYGKKENGYCKKAGYLIRKAAAIRRAAKA